jgi:hypothetical protein
VAEIFLGVKAERQSLESIAQPLTAEDASGRFPGAGPGAGSFGQRERDLPHLTASSGTGSTARRN